MFFVKMKIGFGIYKIKLGNLHSKKIKYIFFKLESLNEM